MAACAPKRRDYPILGIDTAISQRRQCAPEHHAIHCSFRSSIIPSRGPIFPPGHGYLYRSTLGTPPHRASHFVIVMNGFRFGAYQFNPDGTLWCEGSLVPLSPMQRRLLVSFCHRPRQVIAKEVLMLEVWGRQEVPQVSLARTIHGLRRRLSHFQQGAELIRNIYGEGYLFNAGVELLQEQRLADPHPAVIADARSLAMV